MHVTTILLKYYCNWRKTPIANSFLIVVINIYILCQFLNPCGSIYWFVYEINGYNNTYVCKHLSSVCPIINLYILDTVF
jgi:hypothetical protein